MSATVKQKKAQAVITRTTAPDALVRYILGLLLAVLGMAALASLFSGAGSIAFRMIREIIFGLTGSFPWPLPLLMVWTGGAMMLSCYHSVNGRSVFFAWVLYLSVLALMTMLTYVNGVGPLMAYIRSFNNEHPGLKPGSFQDYSRQIFEWGVNGRYPICGGGALSMALAYPFYCLFGNTFGIILLFVMAAGSLAVALRIRVGAMIRGGSDWLEKKRTEKGERQAASPEQGPQAPHPPDEGGIHPSGAEYTYDTFDQNHPAYPASDANMGDAGWPRNDGGIDTAVFSGGSRFVPVGDGNTLYNEDFVLHPKKKEKARPSARQESRKNKETVLEDGSVTADFQPAEDEMSGIPVPSAAVNAQSAPAGIPETQDNEAVPMTEQDFMPPERKTRRQTEKGQSLQHAATAPSGNKKQAAEKEKVQMVPDEKAPWEPETDQDDPSPSDWQIQLEQVSRGLFSSQPVKLKDRKSSQPEVVTTDPAVHMDEPVSIVSSEKKVKAGDKQDTSKLDDTPAVKPARKDNPFSLQPYTPPPINFLAEPKLVNREESTQEDVRRAQQIERTLSTFNIQTQVREITHGPAITRFALKIAEGVKVKQVVGVLDNIALEMGSDRLRIEAPIPGTSYIGIEVPNSKVSSVTLREVLDSEDMHAARNPLVVALGKDIAGKPILCDLSRMPHLLIAGATGSGKSVCINSIVCSLLYRASPEDVRLIMVDPKQVELQVYNGIPHLLIPVISDPKKASSALNWVVNEMFDRYGKFSSMSVRNLDGYNKKVGKDKKLPNIVVIIDEMADLMEVCRKDVEESVRRLAALARAAGIYMVLATQRPSVDVITGVIKNNIPSRIAFTVSSGVDSRTIIDVNGAEKLMGKGDMLYQPTGASKPTRVQGCFVSDEEVARITENIVTRYQADYNLDIQSQMDEAQDSAGKSSGDEAAAESMEGEFNDLLSNAIRMAVEDGQTSISMLQRRLRIGYARAGRLVDEMTKRGIVSESEGSKPRKVLISREQFLEWLKENGEAS